MSTSTINHMEHQQKIRRRKGACGNCKKRKTRCDGMTECTQCKKSNLSCHYTDPTHAKEKQAETNQAYVSQIPMSEHAYVDCDYGLSQQQLVKQPNRQITSDYCFGAVAESQHDTSNVNSEAFDESEKSLGEARPATVVSESSKWNTKWSLIMSQNLHSLSPLTCLQMHIGTHVKSEDLKQYGMTVSTTLISKIHVSMTESSLTDVSDMKLPLNGKDHNTLYSTRETGILIDSFFNETYHFRPYLLRTEFDHSFADFTMSPTLVEPNFIALCNAILAIGSDLHLKRNPAGDTPESTLARNMTQYFQTALYYQPVIFSSPPSTLKLQVLVTMLLFCHSRAEVDLTKSLLSKALECIHALGLYREPTTSETSRHEGREKLEIMCRLVYIIQHPFTLRFGVKFLPDEKDPKFPLIATSDDQVSHPFNAKKDWEIVHTKYSSLCKSIVSFLFGGHQAASPSEYLSQVKTLHHAVLKWESLIPAEYRPIENLEEALTDHAVKRQPDIARDVTLKFCEVMLAIHRWAIFDTMLPVDLRVQYLRNVGSSRAICLNYSKQILRLTQLISPRDQKTEWALHYLPAVAFAIVFQNTTASWGSKHEVAYRIACGIYARLAISCPGDFYNLFDEVNQLSIIANRCIAAAIEMDFSVAEKGDEMWSFNDQQNVTRIFEENTMTDSVDSLLDIESFLT